MKKRSYGYILLVLGIILIFAMGFFSVIGTANISILDSFKIIGSKIPLLKKYIDITNIKKSHQVIMWSVRLPRIFLGVLVGSSLAIAGAAFQGLFQNPMADPYIMGISSGAALGASLAIVFKINIKLLNIPSISIFAFLGGIIAVFVVYNIGTVENKISTTRLLLSGIAVGQFLTAIMSIIMVFYSNDLSKIIFWTMGGLAGKGWEPFIGIVVPTVLSMIFISFFSRDLNIMLTGEKEAKSMGVDIEKTKLYILVLGTFMTAMVVSVSGIIGFVGLIIPHVIRIIMGPDNRILIPASGLVGGIFIIVTDTIARTIISPVEIPVGIITSLLGGPFFIYLLKIEKKANMK